VFRVFFEFRYYLPYLTHILQPFMARVAVLMAVTLTATSARTVIDLTDHLPSFDGGIPMPASAATVVTTTHFEPVAYELSYAIQSPPAKRRRVGGRSALKRRDLKECIAVQVMPQINQALHELSPERVCKLDISREVCLGE
jgi:hypothetical protein